MTDAEILAWLRKDYRKRVVLVEIDYMYQVGVSETAVPTRGTLYFSNFAYVDDETTNPPIRYQAALIEAPEYERSLDRATLRGKYNVNVGSTVINNADGEFDYMLDLALDGSEQRVFVGDETWARSDFVHLFSALSVKASAKPKKRITIDLRDPSLLLNKSIGGMVPVGGTDPSANKFRPVVFGFVHQLQPILLDVTVPRYVFADTGTNTSVVDVRNDGVPVTFTDNTDGTFDLAVPPTASESITCDVLAASGFDYRASDAFDFYIGGRAGLSALGRYTGAGVMYELDGANDYHIGKPLYDKTNCIEIANDLCNTINGFWAFTRLGSFYYSWMRPEALQFFLTADGARPAVPVSAEIGKDDIRGDSLAIDHNIPTYANYQAYGNVNWSQQSTFSSSLDAADREQYTRKGYITPAFYGEEPTSTAYRGDVVSWQGGRPELYDLSLSDSQLVETLISGPDDTTVIDSGATFPESVDSYLQNWASVRRSQNLPWIEFIDFTASLDLYALELGDIVRLTFPRHGLNNGKLLQVCKIRIKPMKATIDIGLVRRRFADVAVAPNTAPRDLLQESGDSLLQETGDHILIESGGDAAPTIPPVPVGIGWNPSDDSTDSLLSNGNRTIRKGSGSGREAARSTTSHNSGKVYFECVLDVLDSSSNTPYLGIVGGSYDINVFAANHGPFGSANDIGIFQDSPPVQWRTYKPGSTSGAIAGSATATDVWGFAIDFTAGSMWIHKNGTYVSGNPSTNTSPSYTGISGTFFAFAVVGGNGIVFDVVTGRFTRSDLTYTVPTGFLAWDGT